ncbi:MAG: hypothetical protein ACOC36_07725, partial [Fibrobacterota bacterium]
FLLVVRQKAPGISRVPFVVRHAWRCSIWCKSRTGVVDDEPLAEGKGVRREAESEGSRSKGWTRRTETAYKA